MRHIFSFLATGVIGVLVLSACNSTDKKTSSSSSPGKGSSTETIHADGVRRITVVELQGLLARNEAVVVDVRSEDSYKAGHIRGAKLIPVADTLKHANELPKDKLIVTYCS